MQHGRRKAWPAVALAAIFIAGLAWAASCESAEPAAPGTSAAPGASAARVGPQEDAVPLCDAVRAPQGKDEDSAPYVRARDGWIVRTGDLSDDYSLSEVAAAGLTRFVAALRRRGTELAILLLPPRAVLAAYAVDLADPLAAGFDPDRIRANYHAAIGALGRTGASVPDLLDAAVAAGVTDQFYFRRDHHWRPEGARVAMQATVATVHARFPALAFTPVAAENRLVRPRLYRGLFGRRVERLCGIPPLPPETYPDYDSVLTGAVTEQSLLGDAPAPEVVLAGTSHSNGQGKDLFNATGWLRAATGTDALDVAVVGGGHDTALLAWLDTPAARDTPPRLLVWELSVRVPKDFEDFFREAVPTLAGPCASPLATGRTLVAAESSTVLAAPPGMPAGGAYLSLEADDPALVKFFVRFVLDGGLVDEVAVSRSTRVPNSRRFFVEAPDRAVALSRIDIRGAAGQGGSVTGALCRYPR